MDLIAITDCIYRTNYLPLFGRNSCGYLVLTNHMMILIDPPENIVKDYQQAILALCKEKYSKEFFRFATFTHHHKYISNKTAHDLNKIGFFVFDTSRKFLEFASNNEDIVLFVKSTMSPANGSANKELKDFSELEVYKKILQKHTSTLDQMAQQISNLEKYKNPLISDNLIVRLYRFNKRDSPDQLLNNVDQLLNNAEKLVSQTEKLNHYSSDSDQGQLAPEVLANIDQDNQASKLDQDQANKLDQDQANKLDQDQANKLDQDQANKLDQDQALGAPDASKTQDQDSAMLNSFYEVAIELMEIFTAIRAPGHTSDGVIYSFKNNKQLDYFTGDTIYIEGGIPTIPPEQFIDDPLTLKKTLVALADYQTPDFIHSSLGIPVNSYKIFNKKHWNSVLIACQRRIKEPRRHC